MKRKGLTTGEVADYCHVTTTTICNWIKSGRLKAYRTPGGHYRIHLEDFKAFLKDHGIPIKVEFFAVERQKILVVDDDQVVIKMVISILQSRFPTFIFESASNGYEAGFHVATFEPDLLILDLVMPYMDGFEVCRNIKASPKTRGIKILILTGHPENQNVENALACGADDYLLKPFGADALIEKVTTLLLREDRESEEAC